MRKGTVKKAPIQEEILTNQVEACSAPSNTYRRKALAAGATTLAGLMFYPAAITQAAQEKIRFKRVRTQYIAALGNPQASSGSNAQEWGLWQKDPGPRGVDLDDYEKLVANGNVAPAQWSFDNEDWWLEEHGLIMEAPEFPLPAGRYLVTGDREAEAILTVHPMTSNGSQQWELDNDASIYDVTHLRCRSGRYTPAKGKSACTPANAQSSDFPVKSGAEMPTVGGCSKLDYAVFIVRAIAVENG